MDHIRWPEVIYNTGELDLSFRLEKTRFGYEGGLWKYVRSANVSECSEHHSQSAFGDKIWLISEGDLS